MNNDQNTTKPTARKNIWGAIIIIALICFPLYFGAESAVHRYYSGQQKECVQQFWLPENAEVFTDHAEWMERLCVTDTASFEVVHDFEKYKTLTGSKKQIVFYDPGRAVYASIHGQMVISSVSEHLNWPAGTSIVSHEYIGEGKMKLRLERDLPSSIIVPLFAAIIKGGIADVLVIICVFLFSIIWDKISEEIKNRKDEREANETKEKKKALSPSE